MAPLKHTLRKRQAADTEMRNSSDVDLARLRIRTRHAVTRDWRRNGRFGYTEYEVSAEVERRMNALLAKLVANPQGLFDFAETDPQKSIKQPSTRKQRRGENAAAARAESFERSQRRATSRRVAALEAFEAAGERGLTRYELSQRLGCEQCSVTRSVQELREAMQIVELSERRRSASGGEGCVLVLARFAEAANHE